MNNSISPHELQKENALLKEEIALLKEGIAKLDEQLAWFKKQIFGPKKDKIVPLHNNQLLFDGFEAIDNTPPEPAEPTKPNPPKKPRKPTGKDKIQFPENLPIERQVLDIPEEDKVCPKTGKKLVKIGEEVTSRLAQRVGSYFIKQIIRPKYVLPQGSEEGIVTAELPESLFNRCQADESLLADIAVKKFADHLPLNRQSEIMARDDIRISKQILSQWMFRVGVALKPLYDEMLRNILASNNVFYDETPVAMLSPGKGKVHQAYMWVIVGGKSSNPGYRVYDFRTNRRHENAVEILGGYSGVLHSDKYGAYESLANQKKFTWCPCWAHIRRKFIEAEAGDPKFRDWVLNKIESLFKLEQDAWEKSEEERLLIRQEQEVPIIDELITAVKERLIDGTILPKSKFRTALGYFHSLIPYLKNYTLNPFARLDNNVAERAVRPLAVGRKNWLFVGNENGGETAAVILSLVQSCRAFGVNPREYLEDIMRRIMGHNASRLFELLPDQWAAARHNVPLA